MEKYWFLSTADIFNKLPEDERAFFYRKSFRRKYSKKSIIFSPGNQESLIYYILNGKVKIYSLSKLGKEVIHWFRYPNEFFGLAEACCGEARTVFAEAAEDTEVLCINRSDFENLIRKSSQFALCIIEILARRIRQAHGTIKDLAVYDVRSRLIQVLVNLCHICGLSNRGSIAIEGRLTHEEIARMIGATRTTVTEIMNEFKKERLIKYNRNKITILNYRRLAGLIEPPD